MHIRAKEAIHGSEPIAGKDEDGKPVVSYRVVTLAAGAETEVSDDYGAYLVDKLGVAERVGG